MKRRSFLQLTFHFNLAAVFLNNSVHDRQPEAGPVIFRGKKWIEDMRDVLLANALPIIANTDPQGIV